ncbi:5-(carboxyamino)imidazole ribonucleotide synthase [Ornithinibacillus halophilus]|uniref:N5-carboxyaminoimidazole ribonucleotide synthase n=1 Tax=Ornithinibacillus halophilus TaxID=930117 RepID=A0A1M5ES75_9BACI|nr:5-(carboxyamino)imidazole ribonucleotide synthase [Ornithinibacillus halophilus]SHF82128.1 5-(carboxyamino)imidazole ribonucleotide synthase [Ornithinibacillus halophilus]
MQNNRVILPPKIIGIIGGGQLGRMMAIAAKYMGYQIIVLDPIPNCPTAQVADKQIIANYDDMNAIKQLTEVSDVITYEFENVDLEAATYIEQQGKLPQGSYALEITQNREKEKKLMEEVRLPIPRFSIVNSRVECEQAFEKITFPAVIKTCRGGYDGKGQQKLTSPEDRTQAIEFVEKHQHCIIEEWISFDKEISVIFTRTAAGAIEFFPIAENEHMDHILHKTMAPAKVTKEVKLKAIEAARVLADKMNIIGTFAIEMFVSGEDIYVNEMAPRPHNSGHYTIESCNISQFTQHIRAICGLPLIPVEVVTPAIMLNILGEDVEPTLHAMPKTPNGFVHFYGKDEVKAKRKMGHITFIGDTAEEQIRQFEEAKQ